MALDSDDDDASVGVPLPPISDFEKVALERKIYLRAALKLLDQRDQILDEKTPERSVSDVIKYGSGSSSSVFSSFTGILKKATGSSVTRSWKDKYVELRHGNFSYGDLSGWGQTLNWKTIRLLSNDIHCYPAKSSLSNGYVFALRETNGQKRLWMTDSLEDMNSWVDAIKTAMIGSAGDFSPEEQDEGNHTFTTSEHPQSSYSNEKSESFTLSSLAPIQLWHKSEYTRSDSSHYFEGLPAYLGAEIRKYLFLQTAISNSCSPTSYRGLLELYFSEPHFTIPVSFVKARILNLLLLIYVIDSNC